MIAGGYRFRLFRGTVGDGRSICLFFLEPGSFGGDVGVWIGKCHFGVSSGCVLRAGHRLFF